MRFESPITEIPEVLNQKYNAVKEGRRTLMMRFSPQDQANMNEMLDTVRQMGGSITDISPDESDLEDIFLQITRG